jgi:CheY-like chemotaxis protein
MATACSVLVVDDDPGVGEAISSALGASYRVQTATTATAALEAISSVPFDLVFLDYHLPDLPARRTWPWTHSGAAPATT